jgi:hypothetical protein
MPHLQAQSFRSSWTVFITMFRRVGYYINRHGVTTEQGWHRKQNYAENLKSFNRVVVSSV